MQRTLRTLPALAALLVAAVALAACGGEDGSAASGADAKTLLDRTASNKVTSGKLDFTLKGEAGSSAVVRATGPFETQGRDKLPKFDLDVAFSGGGQDIKGGVENTGEKGFVTVDGTTYEASGAQYRNFVALAGACVKRGNKAGGALGSLAIDPRMWLEKPRVAGEDEIGGADVVVIKGDVDVHRMLEDVTAATAKLRSSGCGMGAPATLTASQRAQLEKAVKDVRVEIATGKDDSIMRRMKVDLTAQAGSDEVKLSVDLELRDVNQPQQFREPSGARPISALLARFHSLGAGLGALLGGTGGSASGSGGGASPKELQRYTDCLEQAGNDQAKAQKCAALLTP